MARHDLCAITVIVLVLSSALVFAQGPATGSPPFATISGGSPDSIDLGNLNIHVDVPIVAKAGRGLPFQYALSYDSSIWYQITVNGMVQWQPVSNMGWRGWTEALVGYVTYKITHQRCLEPGELQTIYSNYVYHDSSGTPHPFDGAASIATDDCGGVVDLNSTASDGSGYTLTTQLALELDVTVTGRNGPGFNPPRNFSTGAGTSTDSNGNQLTTTGAAFTDTLGVNVLSVSGTNPINYQIWGPNGQVNVAVSYAPYTVQSYFQCSGVAEYPATATNLVDRVTLPDGTYYQFTYEPTPVYTSNVTGRIRSVRLPTGGTISYAYPGGTNGINCADGSTTGINRTTPDSTIPWAYSRSNASGQWQTTIVDPVSNQTVVTFQQSGNNFYETKRTVTDHSLGPLLTVWTCYNLSGPVPATAQDCTGTGVAAQITRRSAWTQPPGQTSLVDTQYETHGLVTETDEYDFGSSTTAGSLLRKTIINYAGIYDRPSAITIQDGSGTTKAQTTFSYTNSVTATNLTPQHVAVSGDRGNLGTVTQWVQGGNAVSRTFTYFDTGLVKSASDLRTTATPTTFTYGECGNAFLTETDYPLTSSGVNLYTQQHWDCNGGVLLWTKDFNQQQTTYQYTDPNFWRVTEVDYPDGGQSVYAYNFGTPNSWNVVQTTKMSSTQSGTTTSLLDGFGRVLQQQLNSDPEGTVLADATYDALGRLSTVTNPHRATSGATDGTTTYSYDALNRTIAVARQDGSSGTASYSGNTQTIADEAGKSRKLRTDGLGRLTAVWEDPAGANLETDYGYDALDNLLSVNQQGQTRTFVYDGLSRLTSETNPESGLTTYSYPVGSSLCSGDPSTVCTRTDARGVVTTYTYDQVNRMTGVAYSDGTHSFTYIYDTVPWPGGVNTYGSGRLVHATNGSYCEDFGYDKMGRITYTGYCFPGGTWYNIYSSYDAAGNRISLTYPSGRVVKYAYNNAARLSTVTYDSYGAQNINYQWATIPNYQPAGMPKTTTYSNGVTETALYNNRLQLSQQTVATSVQTMINRSLAYTGTNQSANNGNVITVTDLLQSGRTQNFAYDSLNRLLSANTTATSGPDAWTQSFSLDNRGNLTNVTGTNPFSKPVDGSNRLTDTTYDAAGNIVHEGPSPSRDYTYDGAGRLVAYNGTAATYVYGPFSERLQKNVGGTSTRYLYLDGQILSEIDPNTGYITDYVYAAGRKIIRAYSYHYRIEILGTNCSNCGWQYSGFDFPNAAGYAGYVVQNGDRLYFQQWQQNGAQGGMMITFSDASTTNWYTYDQDGQQMNSDTISNTNHLRRVDLSQYAGKAIWSISVLADGLTAPGSSWQILYKDIALVSADGTVRPIYTNQSTVSLNIWGTSGSSRSYQIDTWGGAGPYVENAHFYNGDHLGSARLLTAWAGAPVWSGTFLPYGVEWNPTATTNNYKFTDQEHDAETGDSLTALDHFWFRQYRGGLGRWMSPDPAGLAAVDPSNPQSWNRYAYVANNPTNFIDPLGLAGGTTYSYEPIGHGCYQVWQVFTWEAEEGVQTAFFLRGYFCEKQPKPMEGPPDDAANNITPQQRAKAVQGCNSTFRNTTFGRVVRFGSVLSFVDNFWGTAKSWAEAIGTKYVYFRIMGLGGKSANLPVQQIFVQPAAEVTGVTSVVKPAVGKLGTLGLVYATGIDAAVQIGCSTTADNPDAYTQITP